MYTRERYTRARQELVALLRASLRYRMAALSRKLRPRSTLATDSPVARIQPPRSLFLRSILYITLCVHLRTKKKKWLS